MGSKATVAVAGPKVLGAAPAKYDLIIKGGRVINPARKLDAIRDVAIANGRIAAVKANISPRMPPKQSTPPASSWCRG